ncbi:MAG: hypothetical protein KVP17_004671 [Porospora cf. gigantea B]|uniref:uncharacterized protein n=1 Tax=Porospora cf. gigantea B TaxID=2853592 RepID=UPI0035719C3D|nr:MAG: hypothetical protein KVP17_004671 [Porospora cf. gigantea B]
MLWKPAQSQDTSTHSHDIRLYAGDIVRGEMASFVMNEKQTGAGRMRATLELQPIWEEPSVVHIPCDPSCGLLPGCDWATSQHKFQAVPPTLPGALAEGTPVTMGGEVPDMLLYFSAAYCDGKVWLFGGVDHSGSLQDTLYCMQPPEGEPSKTDPIYNPLRLNDMFRRKTVRKSKWEHVWSSSPVVPRGRALHALVGIPAQHKLVLFGGFCSDGVLGDTWIFDTRTRQWSERAVSDSQWIRSPSPRMGHTAVVVDSNVYLFSGWGEGTGSVMGFLDDTWSFNAGTESWDRLQGPLRRLGSFHSGACQEASPCGRYLHLSCHYNNYVYVLGGLGRSPIRPLKDMWRFSIEAEVWERVAFRGVPPRPDYVLWLPINVLVGDRWVVCPDYEFHFERRRWMLAHSAPLAQEAVALQRRR